MSTASPLSSRMSSPGHGNVHVPCSSAALTAPIWAIEKIAMTIAYGA